MIVMERIDWRKEYCLYKKELFNAVEDPDFLKMAVEGMTQYFPFERAGFISYDAEKRIKQGAFGCGFNQNDILSIKEDVRECQAFFMAAMGRRTVLLKETSVEKLIPQRYIQIFSLRSLIIQPLITAQNVNGFLILDLGCRKAIRHDSILFNLLQIIGNELGILSFRNGAAAHLSVEPESKITLSPRELQVMQGLAYGLSVHEIADDLGINQLTVRDYCSSILRKLGAINRSHAVAIGFREGMIN
jgi:DNA-binding CsgD family transcriptional regulator